MILTAMLVVLGLEVLLLLLAFYFSNMGPQMNQNAMDIVEKQVENRSAYLENVMLANQDLSVLSAKINETTASLTEEGAIDLETLDDSGENAMPLLSAVSSDLISTLRSKSVTGIFMVLNTEDLDQIGADVTLPGVYIRDLDPLTTPSERNMDLLLERSPIQLVKQMDVSTDKGWFSSFPPEALEEESFIYQVFQAAYQDKGQLDAAEYGRWTRKPFVLKGDGRSALAYTIPLIFEDGTVYGVLGVEMLTSYMQSLIPNKELQNQGFGTYYLASTREDLSGKSVEFQEAACSPSAGTIQNFSAESMTLTKESGDYWLKDTQTNKVSFASVRPLTLYSRNAPFSGEQWVLVGTVETTYLFAFSNHVIFLMGVAIVMIVAVVLIVFGVMKWLDVYTRHGEAVVVPDVKGMTVDEASKMFRNHGLVCVVSDSNYVKNMAAGIVLDVNPGIGQKVKEGRTIYLTINTLSIPLRAVPDVADNSSLRQAQAKVLAAGFKLTEIQLMNGEKDWVYGIKYQGRSLNAGDKVPLGAALTLMVGNGENEPLESDSMENVEGADEPVSSESPSSQDDSWF